MRGFILGESYPRRQHLAIKQMTISIKSSKAKGRELENWIVQRLREKGIDPRASRNPGSGSGRQKSDIWNCLGWAFEAKNTRKNPGKEAFEQVEKAAMGYQKEAVIWHRPNTPLDASLAIIYADELFELIKQARQPKNIYEPNRQFKYKLQLLKKVITDILKEI